MVANNGHTVFSALLLFLLFTCFYSERSFAAFPFLDHGERALYLRAAAIALALLVTEI